jgi:malate synthase
MNPEAATMQTTAAFHASLDYEFNIPPAECGSVLTPPACAFLVELQARFGGRIAELLLARRERQARFDSGERPDFLADTRELRADDWRVAHIPADLRDRRVEITGPVDCKMIINGLNSGAQVFMADFEDAHAPTWSGTLAGQANLFDAVRRTIRHTAPDGRDYRLGEKTATLVMRPRGLHLPEKHFRARGRPIPAALFDFGLFIFHNARLLIERGSGPYFYLPKLESHREARLWNEIFIFSQEALRIPHGTIRATVLIETLPAVFEMDEILYELRDHVAGLNCGRWDYIFSYLKVFRNDPGRVLPERAQITMTTRFLRSYSQLLIRTCHRRGAFAMGGMAAQIPVRNDPAANATALARVRADKQREADDGHDGTWVAHPGLVPLARAVFDRHLQGPSQLGRLRADVAVTATDLLAAPAGTITEAGLRQNLEVALRYLAAWLGGRGCVPIHGLMEDAATAEIARTQVWQWLRHPRGVLDDGRRITLTLARDLLADEHAAIRHGADANTPGVEQLERAAALLGDVITREELVDFITLVAYEWLD